MCLKLYNKILQKSSMINLEEHSSPVSMEQGSSSPPILKPKGHAIPGLDYGIDMLEDVPTAPQQNNQPPAPSQPSHPSQQQQRQYPPQQRTNGLPRAVSPASFDEGSQQSQGQGQQNNFRRPYDMQSGSASGSGSGSSSGSGSESDGESNGYDDYGSSNLIGNNMQFNNAPEPPQQLTYEQRRERKINAIAALRRLEEAGYAPAGDKQFGFSSDLEELENMVERLKMQRDLDSSIKFQRKFLVGFAHVVEFGCDTEYNIFDLHLQGWSESLFENITDYDEVFEELYYKYKDSVAIMPEVKLLMMVGGSAMMFHMSRELFSKTSSKVPGFDEVMSRDPELRRKYTDAAATIAKERGMPMPSKQDGGMGFLNTMINNAIPPSMKAQPQQHGHGGPGGHGGQGGQGNKPNWKPSRTRVPMNEPDDIDGLLGSLGSKKKKPVTEEIDLSEIENLSDLI